jgi:hypothetical protein
MSYEGLLKSSLNCLLKPHIIAPTIHAAMPPNKKAIFVAPAVVTLWVDSIIAPETTNGNPVVSKEIPVSLRRFSNICRPSFLSVCNSLPQVTMDKKVVKL